MTALALALLAAALVALIAATASVGLQRRRAAGLVASRRRLAALALDAETREQRRLSEALHDTALHTLAATRQDLEEALRGDDASLRRAVAGVEAAIAEIRRFVSELHPAVAEQLGLGAAIHALALEHARRCGFTVEVRADRKAAGVDDAVLLYLARELLANAATHANATQVEVSLTRAGEFTLLEVSDDGRGFDQATRADALRRGHIGLAACQERVEALGGSLTVRSAPGAGATVRVRLPVARERRRVARTRATPEPSPATR